jgi:hypothetical protein
VLVVELVERCVDREVHVAPARGAVLVDDAARSLAQCSTRLVLSVGAPSVHDGSDLADGDHG